MHVTCYDYQVAEEGGGEPSLSLKSHCIIDLYIYIYLYIFFKKIIDVD